MGAVLITCAACHGPESGRLFELSRVDAAWDSGRVTVEYEQRLQLSPEARNALVHGVPLTIAIEVILRDTSSQNRVGSDTAYYEIRYLPLSEFYQVSGLQDNDVRTFPRLRHALAELASLELSFDTGVLPSGQYELLARSWLDKSRMPPPMRLPALFSSEWEHDSAWTSWPVLIDTGS
jgi:hypothetical protein